MYLKDELSLYFKSFCNGLGFKGIDASLQELQYKGAREDFKQLTSDYQLVARDFNKATKRYESTSTN